MAPLLRALTDFLEFLIGNFGSGGTIALIIGLISILTIRKLYADWRSDKLVDAALEEKERTIQRIAKQEREWRLYFMISDGGMTSEEAEALIMRNEHPTPAESRKALERRAQ